MKKIKLLGLFLLTICLSFTFYGCKETNKYTIKEVKEAQNVKIDKNKATLSFDVDSNVSTFALNNIIINKGTIVVYAEKECKNEITTPLDLKNEKNVFYFKVRLNKNNKLLKTVWELTINKVKLSSTTYELYSFEALYNVGDEFKGGKIKKTENSVVEFIDIEESMLTGFDTSKAGEYVVTIKYEVWSTKTTITVFPKGQILVPNYPEISVSEINKSTIFDELIRVAITITHGELGDEYEKVKEELIKEKATEATLSQALSTALYEAGASRKQLDSLYELINATFEDYAPKDDGELSDAIDNIIDMVSRALQIVNGLDTVLSENQIGMITYTIISNKVYNRDVIAEILETFKDDPLIDKCKEMFEKGSAVTLGRNEYMYLGITLYKEVKILTSVDADFIPSVVNVIDYIGKVTSGEEVELTDEIIQTINKTGELLENLVNKVNTSTLDTVLQIVLKTLRIHADDLRDHIETLDTMRLIKNMPGILNFVGRYLSKLTKDDEEGFISVVKGVSYLASPPSNVDVVETGKVLITLMREIKKCYDTLTPKAQLELKTNVYEILSNLDNPISLENVITCIQYYAKTDTSNYTSKEYGELLKSIASLMSPNITAEVYMKNSVIVKQNAAKEELFETLKANIEITVYDPSVTDGRYVLDLLIDYLKSYDTTIPGLNVAVIETKDIKVKVHYLVEPLEPEYVLSNRDYDDLNMTLVIGLDGTIYFNSNITTVYVLETITGVIYKEEIDGSNVRIANPDLSSTGKKTCLGEIVTERFGTFYLPVSYYVVNVKNPEITKLEVIFDNKIFKGAENAISGTIYLTYNYGIAVEIVEEEEEIVKKWYYDSTRSFFFTKSNISGLDTNKAGVQNIAITIDNETLPQKTFYTTVEVLEPKDGERITDVEFYLKSIYEGATDYTEGLSIYIKTVAYQMAMNGYTYQKVLDEIARYNLPYEIKFEALGEIKQGTVKFKLTVKDLEVNKEFTYVKEVDVISSDVYYDMEYLTINLDTLVFKTRNAEEIVKSITGVFASNQFTTVDLKDEAAAEWAKKHIQITIDDLDQITFSCGRSSYVVNYVYFGLTTDNARIKFTNDSMVYIPEFILDFSEEDIFNGIVSYIEFNNGQRFHKNEHNLYQLFKDAITIEKTELNVIIKIAGQRYAEFQVIKKGEYNVESGISLSNYELDKDNLTLDYLTGYMTEVVIRYTSTYGDGMLQYNENNITKSLANHFEIVKEPKTIGNLEAILSFEGKEFSLFANYYSSSMPKELDNLEIRIPNVFYEGTPTAEDVALGVIEVRLNYTNGEIKLLDNSVLNNYDIYNNVLYNFLMNECTITINDDSSIEITHKESGKKGSVKASEVKWYDINKMRIVKNNSYNTSFTYTMVDRFVEPLDSIIYSVNFAFYYDNSETPTTAIFMGVGAQKYAKKLLNLTVTRIFKTIYFTYYIGDEKYQDDFNPNYY